MTIIASAKMFLSVKCTGAISVTLAIIKSLLIKVIVVTNILDVTSAECCTAQYFSCFYESEKSFNEAFLSDTPF